MPRLRDRKKKKKKCGSTIDNKFVKNMVGAASKDELLGYVRCNIFSFLIDNLTGNSCVFY